MNDCNGKMELVQGHDVEQHSRAELQVQTIYSSCVQWTIAGSEALPRSRRGHQTNRNIALSTVSHGPSRYPIARTSWYRLRSPYASLPANLESVAETWKRLAQSFWAPIASKFFWKTLLNAFPQVHDLGHIGKLEANLSSFKTALRLPTLLTRGQYKENGYFPGAWEFGLARRVRQSRSASACSSPYSGSIWCLLTGFLPSFAAASNYLFKIVIIRHRVSPGFIGSRNCVPMAFTAESPPAQGQ